jgi:voltage-gated potassium channel Kch
MDAVGLSMALGAFIAGVLLAESEFRHQLETDIEPFRGLLLGLFFMGFGMTLDWGLISANWALVIGGAIALFSGKAVLLYGLSRAAGSGHMDALRIAATIGQGGEFAFVMITLAIGAGLFAGELPSLLSAIVTLSMILTPAAVAAADRYEAKVMGEDTAGLRTVAEAEGHKVIVAGFGRVGQVVARVLSSRGFDVTLIDGSPRRIRIAQTFGTEVYFGDARRLDVLETAGAGDADLLFLCINDRDGAVETVDKLKSRWPQLKVFAETYDRFSEMAMRRHGVDFAVRQTYESAIRLASAGLRELGEPEETVEDVVEEFRRRDLELLDLQTEFGADEGVEMLRERYRIEDGQRPHPVEGRDTA